PAAPRLSERGTRPGTPGRLRRGPHVVSAGAARPPQRRAHPAVHGDRVHQDAAHRRGDPAIPPSAGARPRARGRPLRTRIPAAQARRSGRGGPAPACVSRAPAQGARRAEMDRARDAGAARPRRLRTDSRGRGGGTLTGRPPRFPGRGQLGGLLVLVAAAACGKFGRGDLSRTSWLEVTAPDSREEYYSATAPARLLCWRGGPS